MQNQAVLTLNPHGGWHHSESTCGQGHTTRENMYAVKVRQAGNLYMRKHGWTGSQVASRSQAQSSATLPSQEQFLPRAVDDLTSLQLAQPFSSPVTPT